MRPAFLLTSAEDFRSVVRGACGLSGGALCHLIPASDGQVADVWLSYIQRMVPDAVYVPPALLHLKPRIEELTPGLVLDIDYAGPVTWSGSPYVHSLLAEANVDGSVENLEARLLVDIELSPTAPPISDMQQVARFGLVPEVPIGDHRFIGVSAQLRDLVHCVPPTPGQGLADWLFSIPHTGAGASSISDGEEGVPIYCPVTLSQMGLWADGQSWPQSHRDSPLALANRLVVIGDAESLEDACLFWNLRANRRSGPLPVWLTPEQAALPELSGAVASAVGTTPTSVGPPIGGVNELHLLSATLDTQALVSSAEGERAVGWQKTGWLNFIDRRYRPFFSRHKEAMHFVDGVASFVVSDDELPVSGPTQITIEVEVESFRPPPTRSQLWGTNGPHTGRFGDAVLSLNCWTRPIDSEEVSLGYPRTFELIMRGCEDVGYRPVFERKAALAYGLHRVLSDEFSAHMVLRSPDVLDVLHMTIDSERAVGKTGRRLVPRGITFGEVKNRLKDQRLARLLLSWLLRRGLMFRGLELVCPECGTQAWYSLNDVGNTFRCVGCQGQQPYDLMPEGAAWRYRVNQLLASALDQGVLQQVLAAYDMDLRGPSGSRSYVFPSVVLEDLHTGDNLIEVDLLGFRNGEWLAAECKGRGDATESELDALRSALDRLGGGSLLLVRASTASDACDGQVDRVMLWDRRPMTEEAIGTDQLLTYLESR